MDSKTLEIIVRGFGMNHDLATKIDIGDLMVEVMLMKTSMNDIHKYLIVFPVDQSWNETMQQLERELRGFLDSLVKLKITKSVLIGDARVIKN